MSVTNVSQAWGAAGTFTCSFASIASGAVQQGTALDLTSFPNILDVEVQVLCQISATPGASAAALLWFYGSVDGTTFPDTISGVDGVYAGNLTNLTSVKQVNVTTAGVQAGGNPISLAAVFGGTLPAKVGPVIQNNTGQAFDGNAAHNKIIYRILYTITQ